MNPEILKKVHLFLKESSIDTIWWYLQLIFKLTSADIRWSYQQIVSFNRAKHCFKNECNLDFKWLFWRRVISLCHTDPIIIQRLLNRKRLLNRSLWIIQTCFTYNIEITWFKCFSWNCMYVIISVWMHYSTLIFLENCWLQTDSYR